MLHCSIKLSRAYVYMYTDCYVVTSPDCHETTLFTVGGLAYCELQQPVFEDLTVAQPFIVDGHHKSKHICFSVMYV
jgi:hypothetical protein